MKSVPTRWLPRSLAARVFLLYGLALLLFLSAGLGAFYRYQFLQQIEETQETGGMLIELAGHTVSDSAVIGDYDTVKRTLSNMVFRTPFLSAKFIDLNGGVLETRADLAERRAPAPRWLYDFIARRLFDLNRVISMGGRDYGVMRLTFDAEQVASRVWALMLDSLAITAACLAGGLLAMRLLLRRWLGELGRLHDYGARLASGAAVSEPVLSADAPAEVRDALQVVNQTAASLRDQYGRRIDGLREHAEVTLHAIADGVVTVSREGQVLFANPAASEVFGLPPGSLIGRRLSQLLGEDVEHLPAGGWRSRQGEVQRAGGGSITVESTLSPLGMHSALGGYVLAIRDISERKAAEDTIHRLAYFDPLTDLPNRRMFIARAEDQVRLAHRSGRGFALLYIDLDRFKNVNDGVGHQVGDQLLVEAGARIRGALRDVDYVGRLGGDEFAALIVDTVDATILSHIAARVIDALEQVFPVGEHELYVSASVGIAVYGHQARDVQTLLKHADTAMYRAKEQGKRTFSFFSDELEQRTRYRLEIERGLRDALSRNELFLEYQPKIDPAGGTVVGAEALLRWRHPTRGRLAPDAFISIAEESRLIVPIGAWVIDEVCRQIAEWRTAGIAPLPVAVNLSPVQFQSPGLTEEVGAALRKHRLPPHLFEVEITESLLMNDPEHAGKVLQALRASGVTVGIDDFGTGYSSLSYLKRFPVRVLKIDRSFVHDLSEDPDDRAIASAIIGLAKSLDMMVVAEGVETPEQRDILVPMGCDYMQGYLFSRPLDPEQFGQFVNRAPRAPHAAPVAPGAATRSEPTSVKTMT